VETLGKLADPVLSVRLMSARLIVGMALHFPTGACRYNAGVPYRVTLIPATASARGRDAAVRAVEATGVAIEWERSNSLGWCSTNSGRDPQDVLDSLARTRVG